MSLLITLIGSDAHALLKSLCTPEEPSKKTFAELCSVLKNHLQPKPSVITERYKFKERRQLENEEVKQYIASLKKLSTFCDFGNGLENHLRDQFVWGLSSDTIKKRLLGEKDLTYEKAIELATSIEAANKDVAEMGSKNSISSGLNYFDDGRKQTGVQRQGTDAGKLACYCCGRRGHISANCRFRTYKCHLCDRSGHLKVVCRLNKSSNVKSGTDNVNSNDKLVNSSRNNDNRHNYIQDLGDINKTFENLFNLDGEEEDNLNNVKPFTLDLTIGKSLVSFEVDTGSPVSAISENKLNEFDSLKSLKVNPTNRRFKSYNGDSLVPLGVVMVQVGNPSNHITCKELELFIFSGKSVPIVGRDWLKALGLVHHSSKNLTINSISQEINDYDSLCVEFKEVFSDKLGKYTGGTFQLHLKADAKPIFRKPRPIPYAMREKVENEIKKLVDEGILEPIENSDWSTPIVPVVKSDGRIRICGDYKVSINPYLEIDRYPIPRISDLLTKIVGGTVY